MIAFHDPGAMHTGISKVECRFLNVVGFVIEGSCQNARGGGLADPPNAGQHIGLGNPVGGKRI